MTTETQTRLIVQARPFGVLLAQAYEFRARGGTRPSLEGVYVEHRAGTLRVAAADGYRLIDLRGHGEGFGTEDFGPIILAPESAEALIKAIKGIGRADVPPFVTLTEDEAVIDNPHGTVRLGLMLIQATFPNYEQLIPPDGRTPAPKVGTQPAQMAKAYQLAAKYANPNHTVVLSLGDTTAPIKLEWQDEADQWTATAVLMPTFIGGRPVVG